MPMNDPVQMQLSLSISNDHRLLAGLAAAIGKVAELAGLAEKAAGDLASAALETCENAFPLLANGEDVQAYVRTYADRVEIAVEYRGESKPAAGLETFLGAGGGQGVSLLNRVDGVNYSTADGLSQTTIVKKRPQ